MQSERIKSIKWDQHYFLNKAQLKTQLDLNERSKKINRKWYYFAEARKGDDQIVLNALVSRYASRSIKISLEMNSIWYFFLLFERFWNTNNF